MHYSNIKRYIKKIYNKKCKSNHIWSKTFVYLDHKSENEEAFLFYFNYAYIFRIYYKSTSNPFIWRYSSPINIWKSKLFLDLVLTRLLYCFTCEFIKTKLLFASWALILNPRACNIFMQINLMNTFNNFQWLAIRKKIWSGKLYW